MHKKYPSADQPLNYEHVLFNHLECMSFFVAQGTADLKQMIEIYEQLVIPKTNEQERELLAIFKMVMSDLKMLVENYYDNKMNEVKNQTDKPEAELQELMDEKEDTLDSLEDVYYKMLLRFLVVATKRRLEGKETSYKDYEFWRDLKVELRDVLPFEVEIVDKIVNEHIRGSNEKKIESETNEVEEYAY